MKYFLEFLYFCTLFLLFRCHNVARLRNYVCQSKRIPFAHPNALPRLSTERLRTNLLWIIAHTESQDTATDESDEQDSSSSESSDYSAPSPDRNNTLWKVMNLLPHLTEWLQLSLKWAGRYLTIAARALNFFQIKSTHMYRCKTSRWLHRKVVTRPTLESEEQILPSAGTNC